MAQQSSFYFTDGVTRTFPSTKHIASKQHVVVYFKSVATNTWGVIEQTFYDVVNQSVVFTNAPDNVLYSELEVRVADTATELTQSPSDIALVAGSIANVNTVAGSIANVNSVATNIATVNTVSGSIANVNTVAGSIANVNSVAVNATNVNTVAGSIANVNLVATTVVPNITEILAADDNAAIATTQAGIATTQAGLSTASATNSQLRAWEAEAERLTADSYATEAEDVVVKVYTSNGDGTFTATPTTEYSALHWSNKAILASSFFAPTVGTIAALRTTVYSGQPFVSVTGYYTAPDNIGVREYYWDATSTEADNGGTIIQVTGVTTGRWKMKFSGAINLKWFGAKGDWNGTSGTDDSTALSNAIASIATGGNLYVPSSKFYIGTGYSVTSRTDINIYGDGKSSQFIYAGSFNINGSSNITLRNLSFENTNSMAESYTIFILNGGSNINVTSCYIKSTGGLVMVNSDSANLTTTNVNIDNNYMETTLSPFATGCRTRYSLDLNRDVKATFRNNTIIMTRTSGVEVGIETWSDNSIIDGNRILSPNLSGGFGGITIGASRGSKVTNNSIYGFSAAIELGNNNYGDTVVDGNQIHGSMYGVFCTSSGTERAVVISNNTVIFDDKIRTDYIAAFATVSKLTDFIGNTAIHIDTSTIPSFPQDDKPYLDADSRKYYAFYGDTNIYNTNIVGNTIINFNIGIRCSSSANPLIQNNISSNTFDNVHMPVSDSGGNPYNNITSNVMRNFNACLINSKSSFVGNTFVRDSDFVTSSSAPNITAPYAEVNNTAVASVLYNYGNRFINCANSVANIGDLSFAIQGAGYGRCHIEFTDNKILTLSCPTWTDVKNKFIAHAEALPYNVNIHDWPSNKTFIRRTAVKNADIIDGTDYIENYGV